jgi:hypothetical protein
MPQRKPRQRQKACGVILACLFFASAAAAGADPAQPGAAGLKEKAVSLGLAYDGYWKSLLHYAGKRSRIDDPSFFIAPTGKEDPQAELLATVDGFFEPASEGDKHPSCRFPARREWITERLGISPGVFPAVACGEYSDYIEKVEPTRAFLVFPAGYLNNPASMFGHTLIRIDGGYENPLLGYAVNYAARTPESNGMVYAVKGLLGLYPGYFSILPYYQKVKEYSDLEHRDMWEYRLNLTAPEVRRMTAHIWELKDIWSDYYFFDENCSYNLLFLLDAARPSLDLATHTGLWVIPSDTLRLVQEAGLVSETKFRPSMGRRMALLAKGLTRDGVKGALAAARGEVPATALPAGDGGRALELSAEYLQYLYGKEKVSVEEYRPRFLSIVTRRSSAAGELPEPEQPAPPETGHRTARIWAGGGRGAGEPFVEAGFRPAYHDLLDPQKGYTEGSQILFLDTALRYLPKREELLLERLTLVDILSLSPWDPVFKPTSWSVRGGVERRLVPEGDAITAELQTAAGITLQAGRGSAALLAGTELFLSNGLRDKASPGAGVSAYLVQEPLSGVRLSVKGDAFFHPVTREWRSALSGEGSVSLTPRHSLRLRYGVERSFGRTGTDILGTIETYL